MARLPKVGVDHFPHYVGSRDSKILCVLKAKFGNDGYAFWYQLLEILGGEEGLSYDCNYIANWLFLTASTSVSEEMAKEILDMLAELGVIDAELWSEDKVIWCQEFANSVAPVYRKRKRTTPERPLSKKELQNQKTAETEERAVAENVTQKPDVKKIRKEGEKEVPRGDDPPIESYVDSAMKEPFIKWLSYKKSKGQDYNEISKKTCYEELVKYSDGDPEKAQDIINKSIAMNYNGFFRLGESSKLSKNYTPEYVTNGRASRGGTNISTI